MRKYAARPNLARVLCDYIMYVVSFVFCVLGVGGGAEGQDSAEWLWQHSHCQWKVQPAWQATPHGHDNGSGRGCTRRQRL